MRDAAEGVLGLTIQYYVLIDMQGFSQLIDALGGIDITVAERVPLGSNHYDDGSPAPAIGYIEAGPQRMNGETALWYARSRYATTDYVRMARQREVQEAIIAQANPANVLTNFSGDREGRRTGGVDRHPAGHAEPLRRPGRPSPASFRWSRSTSCRPRSTSSTPTSTRSGPAWQEAVAPPRSGVRRLIGGQSTAKLAGSTRER